MGDIGKVIEIDMDSITLMRGVHEFKGFNGSEAFLNITQTESICVLTLSSSV